MRDRAIAAAVGCLVLVCGATGCGLRVPADPEGTLARAEGDALRVGVALEPGLAEQNGSRPSGTLVSVAAGFAESIDAEPVWTVRSEETLVRLLEDGRIDLAIGGFTEETPWTDRVGVSRAFRSLPGAEGRAVVVLVRLGENALLSEAERFLDGEGGA